MRAEMGKTPSRAPPSQLNLPPGFRFYPTDEELVVHYLCKKAASEPFSVPIIAEIELYKFNPWDLPDKALFGEREWFFFTPRDRKYPNGSRPNRAAGCGYWKATGTDKPIHTLSGAAAAAANKKVGVKKALVFYKGKAPKGVKTNWIMHEYRLADSAARSAKRKGSLRLDDWVLCRIYKKSSSDKLAAAATVKDKTESSCLDDGMTSTLPETSSGDGAAAAAAAAPNIAAHSGFYVPDFSNLYNHQVHNSMLNSYNNGHVNLQRLQQHLAGVTHHDQGAASSVELSEHHGFGSRQHSGSTPESAAVQEPDDAVDSCTFTTPAPQQLTGHHVPAPGACSTSTPISAGPRAFHNSVQTCFGYGSLDTGLSSPGAFAGLVDSDYSFFSSPTAASAADLRHHFSLC